MCDRLSHINEYNAQHEDHKTHHRTTRLATRRAMCGPLRGPVPYMGGCAGACRLLLHSVVSLSPRALMPPGACGHDSTYLTRANGCSRRPRAWAWGDIADLVRCRAEGRVPERDRDCTYQVLAVTPGVVHRVCRLEPGPGLAQPEAVSWVGDGADGSPGLFAESAGRRHDERVEYIDALARRVVR